MKVVQKDRDLRNLTLNRSVGFLKDFTRSDDSTIRLYNLFRDGNILRESYGTG
jgi:hypothetical protein